MNATRILIAVLIAGSITRAAEPPLVITGDEQSRIDFALPDGGLPAYPGVDNVQVFRATRGDDGAGWTYHHHVDMACWKGRLYLAWDSCVKDEDVGESRELYATSGDGVTWSDPKALFPQGLSTHLRMFFFRAPNGRMLAIAGLRLSNDPLNERQKGPVIVREIKSDHALGEVFLLRPPNEPTTRQVPPAFNASADAGFVEACNQLLANKPFLEQSDYGQLLGDRKMKWHDSSTWPADEPSRPHFHRFGKGMQFFHRKDGALVAVMKWGWVMLSRDEGETWTAPVRPSTFVSGMAKAWGQRTPDGRYLLAYNPSLTDRYPLVAVTGDDGVTFDDMRVVHGELPAMRYPGLYKGPGPQYVRGVSEWSTDGSRDDAATWLAYSVNKEDIWVSRVPPRKPELALAWNTYGPRWAPATVKQEADGSASLDLEDADPADYARAFRSLAGAKRVDVAFSLQIDGPAKQRLLVQLEGPRSTRALTLPFEGKAARIRIAADAARNAFSLWDDDRLVVDAQPLAQAVERFDRILFTTDVRPATHSPEQDNRLPTARFSVRKLKIATN